MTKDQARARVRLRLLAACLALLGCREQPEIPTGERPSQRHEGTPDGELDGAVSSYTLQIRNACPEAVVIAVGPDLPGPSTPTSRLRSTAVEAITVEQGARVWLRYDNRFDGRYSLAPTGDGVAEVGFQCDSIYLRPGRL